MQSCDFSRSFATFTTHERTNNARIQIEARCLITDANEGASEQYYLVASCKAEDTYGKGVLFYEQNYDFCVIFSEKENRIFRVGFPYDEKKTTLHTNTDRFHAVAFHIQMTDADLLPDNEAVVKATLENRVINGRTEIASPDKRYQAMIEFPVKTMNVNDIRNVYQTDTGPILLPDFDMPAQRMIERFRLAFVAYNKPDEAYFIIQEPVAGQPDHARVADYSRIVRMDAKNSVLALR